jgi:hypothetical protein
METNTVANSTGIFLKGQGITLEFVNNAAFTTASCSDPTASSVPGISAPCGGLGNGIFCGVGAAGAGNALEPPVTGNQTWCTGACKLKGMLVYSTSTGPFYLNGPGVDGYLRGTVSWQNGPCMFWSNGGGILYGQIACNSMSVMDSGAGLALDNSITYDPAFVSRTPDEAALVE